MNIPFFKEMKIGAYLLKQKLQGRKRYPLVLMLEPLFRCNLACVGCGKIDYPDAILNRLMSAQECWDAADAGQIAAKQRREHQHQRKALPSEQFLLQQIAADAQFLEEGYCHYRFSFWTQ